MEYDEGVIVFFFQAEDGIRDAQESRGLGDVYKRQRCTKRRSNAVHLRLLERAVVPKYFWLGRNPQDRGTIRFACLSRYEKKTFVGGCLLYTSDAADDLLCVDLGGRRIIKKKKHTHNSDTHLNIHYYKSAQILYVLLLSNHITMTLVIILLTALHHQYNT